MERYRLDHVVIVVDQLLRAVEDFAELGFTVTEGGEHEGRGTHNALIPLQDDSYLELIAFRDKGDVHRKRRRWQSSPVGRRMLRWGEAEEGVVDFALLPAEIELDVARARERGLALEGPLPGGRRRPDGQQVAWQFAFPDGPDLPFLCADVSDRALRVPPGAFRKHSNGAQAITGLTVDVRELARSTRRYSALLGMEPTSADAVASTGASGVMFALPGTEIYLIEGDDGTSAGAPEGLCQVTIRAAGLEERRVLDPELTHGARIELMPAAE
jgi:hypothetical protein